MAFLRVRRKGRRGPPRDLLLGDARGALGFGELEAEQFAEGRVREEGLKDPAEGGGGELVREGQRLLHEAQHAEGVGAEELPPGPLSRRWPAARANLKQT